MPSRHADEERLILLAILALYGQKLNYQALNEIVNSHSICTLYNRVRFLRKEAGLRFKECAGVDKKPGRKTTTSNAGTKGTMPEGWVEGHLPPVVEDDEEPKKEEEEEEHPRPWLMIKREPGMDNDNGQIIISSDEEEGEGGGSSSSV